MKNDFDNDINLVERCIKKDLGAWSAFIKKYSNLIFISIENRLKKCGLEPQYQELEDIRQNLLASIWKDRKLEDIKNRNDISYWLAIVSGNAAIEYLRNRLRREPAKTISLFDRIGQKELSELIPAPGLVPSEELARGEISKRIEEVIGSLPTKEKLIIKLNLLHDKKYYEIAKILNLPKGTVSSYIKRAKEKLRQSLKDFR